MNQSTAQFAQRVARLGDETRRRGHRRALLPRAYDLRSAGVHGERVPFHANPEAAGELDRLLTVLRRALRRAIQDHEFRERFTNAETVRRSWPLV